jgi:ADP-heptose:LPS heptosyltransferase
MSPTAILLVCLDNLGDLVFSSALTPILRATYPQARIDVWCKAYCAAAASLIPDVSNVIAADPFYDRDPRGHNGPVLPFLLSVLRARFGHYDVALVTGAPWRTAAAVASTGIPVRIGFARHRNGPFLTHVLAPADRARPAVAELGRLLDPLGIEARPAHYALDGSALAGQRAIIAAQLPNTFAVLHPFAARVSRCAPLREWMTVAGELDGQGIAPVWLGLAHELAHLRALGAPGVMLDDIANGCLARAMAVVSMARLFVGHDSGPMHVASALSVPTVGVFAPGEPLRTFPQGRGPWRIVCGPGPDDVHARDILDAILNAKAALLSPESSIGKASTRAAVA